VLTIGLLHPGQMGAAVGAAARAQGSRTVLWAQAGRSDATVHRAELADLVAVPTVADVAARSDVVVSLCPPAAALDVARAVADAGAPDLYLDANAIAPSTMSAIADVIGEERTIDGAIIGPPPWRPGTTVLMLSGTRAAETASLFTDTPLRARVVGDRIGQASAVKACFALQSKALPTVWATIAAAAQHYEVAGEVRAILAEDGVDLDAHLAELARRATAKAWRWDGEMAEAARTLSDAGLPPGFSEAAAEVYRRAASATDRDAPPDPQAWVDAVAGSTPG
jgi:3-hydroxyisobutyrate dehydrogenase-like beta-hydroxyacid dehydrogenase